jgi:hypothetical protein
MNVNERKLRIFILFCASIAALFSVSVATYLLWRTALATKSINVAADLLRFGLVSAILAAAASSINIGSSVRRWSGILIILSVSSIFIILYLYLNKLSCSMKVSDICEQLF